METIQFLYSIILLGSTLVAQEDSYTFPNPVRFPYGGSFQGIFLALALPLELEDQDVFVAYNFEAVYFLPENETEFSYPPIIGDESVDRKFVYNMLENKLISHGYPGKSCLLRAICEVSQYSSKDTGLLGDILHIILTPSTSINRRLANEYAKAEDYGKFNGHCNKFNKKCGFSVLKLVSWMGDAFDY